MERFFRNLELDRKIKRRTGYLINETPVGREEETLFLELVYSTSLSVQEIRDLSISQARAILICEREKDLPHVVYTRLKGILDEKQHGYLFDKKFRSRSIEELEVMILANLDTKFVDELRATRVLSSQKEYVILPTPLRLDASPEYTGKGICIGFLDGGFYPHPDIMKPNRRVIAYKDLGSPDKPKSNFEKPDPHSWHGMQTCVSAVGNGYLSDGLYKGIAHEANVALLKVMGDRGFTTEAIVAGIEWCIRKTRRYNIRILNISLGTNDEGSFRESVINHAAEEAVQAGINVVVAAGNDWGAKVTPPANAPSVITVGGLDDRNSLNENEHKMYHSTFGKTDDGIMKPEIIAPGIWVAAPTLPGTPFFRDAELIWDLSHCKSEEEFDLRLKRVDFQPSFLSRLQNLDWAQKKDVSKQISQSYKLVSPYYQHVDGTSFSAPIICSIIAQMLEARSSLTPKAVKEILMACSKRLENVPVEAQGCGVVQARKAVEMAKKRIWKGAEHYPSVKDGEVSLYCELGKESVEVLGSFNNWQRGIHKMQREREGFHLDLLLENQGSYEYKFLVDGKYWLDDPFNTDKSYDGFGGFNSLIHVYGTKKTRETLAKIEKGLDKIKSVKKQSPEHRKLLQSFDDLISYKCISKSPQMKDFYERRIAKVIRDLKDRKVDKGIFLYQLYNSGYIIQTPTLTIGIDVVTTRHVWEVFWDIQEDLFKELADQIDISFVSHRLADHLDLDVVNYLLSKDKLVVVPSGMENLCLNGVIAFDEGESRDLYSLGRNNISLNIEAFSCKTSQKNASDIDFRSYKITIQEKLNIFYIPDHFFADKYRNTVFQDLKKSPSPVDILLIPLPGKEEEIEQELWLKYIASLGPDVIIPTHLAEIGQQDLCLRGSYRRAYELLDKTDKDFEVLVWGDSVKIGHVE